MNQKALYEITWLSITLIVCGLVLLPIYLNVGHSYAFYADNCIFIFLSITFIRYIFLLKHHWITHSKWFKIIFIFLPIAIALYLVDALYNFQIFSDQFGVKSIMSGINYEDQNQLATYIKTEMQFFWVAAFVSNAFLPFRMIISLWRKVNKGTH